MPSIEARIDSAHGQLQALRAGISTVLVGQQTVVDQVLTSLLAGGHCLLEGPPGLGKTLLVRTLASCLAVSFSRIQFTPDLMPSDVIGTNVLVERETGGRSFELHKGPIFGQIVLADEINRATPKTQSALLEAMQEGAVTIAGLRHELPAPFFVLATENPIEMEGTYPLPEAQLDRFLLKIVVTEPSEDELVTVLERTTGRKSSAPTAVLQHHQVLELQDLCRDIALAEPVQRYAARLVQASTPSHPQAPEPVRKNVRFGAGVRGAQSLVLASKAQALLAGRAHVSFGDLVAVAKPCLRHRIIRSFEGEADGVSTDSIVDALLASVPQRAAKVEALLGTRSSPA